MNIINCYSVQIITCVCNMMNAYNSVMYPPIFFAENDITMENIFLLSNDMIKDLIPSIGKRVNFVKNFEVAKLVHQSVIVRTISV